MFVRRLLFCVGTAAFIASPAQAQTYQFTIYFDYADRTDDKWFEQHGCIVSETSKGLLDEIIKDWALDGSPPMLLTAHDDSDKSEIDAITIAQCRMNSVRKYLNENGVTDTHITSKIYGERWPAIDRGDGVREPLNRRVEISW